MMSNNVHLVAVPHRPGGLSQCLNHAQGLTANHSGAASWFSRAYGTEFFSSFTRQ